MKNDLDSKSNLVLSVLFLENRPVEIKRLAKILKLEIESLQKEIAEISERFKTSDLPFEIIQVESTVQLSLKTEIAPVIPAEYRKDKRKKLSKGLLETLAIIAYKQPVTRVEVDTLRGVNCSNYFRELQKQDFIKIAGKKNVPGKPVLYRSTSKFLLHFGLKSLKDLPTPKEVKSYEFLEEE